MPWQKGKKAWNNKRLSLVCLRCKNTYEKPPSQAVNSKYCSRLCQNRQQSDEMERRGSKNPMWKGDKVGYHGMHSWHLKHWVKTNVCVHCKYNKPTDWASIKGRPMIRDDKTKWIELCRSCHSTYDGKINNIKKMRTI